MDTGIKLCKDCRHLNAMQLCYEPKNVRFNYVTGDKRSIHSPQFLREEGDCGHDAKWFEPKEIA